MLGPLGRNRGETHLPHHVPRRTLPTPDTRSQRANVEEIPGPLGRGSSTMVIVSDLCRSRGTRVRRLLCASGGVSVGVDLSVASFALRKVCPESTGPVSVRGRSQHTYRRREGSGELGTGV